MKDLSIYISKDGDTFYFDTENYSEEDSHNSIDYEDGDRIKWTWEEKRMIGTIRETTKGLGLFTIEQVSTLE